MKPVCGLGDKNCQSWRAQSDCRASDDLMGLELLRVLGGRSPLMPQSARHE